MSKRRSGCMGPVLLVLGALAAGGIWLHQSVYWTLMEIEKAAVEGGVGVAWKNGRRRRPGRLRSARTRAAQQHPASLLAPVRGANRAPRARL